jgi:hypothetical protein
MAESSCRTENSLIALASTDVELADASSDTVDLIVPPDTLVGYAGDLLCGEPFGSSCVGGSATNVELAGKGGAFFFLDAGATLTAEVAPPPTTPLPTALPLFAGGLGFVGYLAKRRKKSTALATTA